MRKIRPIRLPEICLSLFIASVTLFAHAGFDTLNTPASHSPLASQTVKMTATVIDDELIVAGEYGHILNWKQADDWVQHHVPVTVAITAVAPAPGGGKVAVGHEAIILTAKPGSQTWERRFDGFELLSLARMRTERQIATLEAKMAATTDEDQRESLEYDLEDLSFVLEDLQREADQGPNKPLLSVAAVGERIIACGAYGILLLSEDRGKTWQLVSDRLPNFDNFHLNHISTTASGHVVITGESGSLFISDDQGETWRAVDLPYHGSLFGMVSDPHHGRHWVSFGLQGNFLTSNDAGASWQAHRVANGGSLLGGAFSNRNRVTLVGHGGIVVDFDFADPAAFNVRKHPSSAAFAAVIDEHDAWVVAGQFGILRWAPDK